MTFFLDLPIEYRIKIINGFKKDERFRKKCKEHGYALKNIDEFLDDFINRLNTPDNVKKWVNKYCL